MRKKEEESCFSLKDKHEHDNAELKVGWGYLESPTEAGTGLGEKPRWDGQGIVLQPTAWASANQRS